MSKLIKSILCAMTMFVVITVDAQVDKNQGLSPRQEAIVNIASLTAVGNLEKSRPALNAGLDAGLTINETKEVLMHLYALCRVSPQSSWNTDIHDRTGRTKG